MAYVEVGALESDALGQANTAGDVFFRLGMLFSIGLEVPADRVAAHKWFNLAAQRGNSEAIRHRRELAEEMSENEIAAAQRAAREWLTAH